MGALPGLVLLFVLRGSGFALVVLLIGWFVGLFVYQIVAAACGGGYGMRALGIRVVRAEDGRRPGVARAATRLFARLIFGMVPVVGSVIGAADLLWMVKDPRKHTWHDKVARTCVVERDG